MTGTPSGAADPRVWGQSGQRVGFGDGPQHTEHGGYCRGGTAVWRCLLMPSHRVST